MKILSDDRWRCASIGMEICFVGESSFLQIIQGVQIKDKIIHGVMCTTIRKILQALKCFFSDSQWVKCVRILFSKVTNVMSVLVKKLNSLSRIELPHGYM